jgi:hypothetical protein
MKISFKFEKPLIYLGLVGLISTLIVPIVFTAQAYAASGEWVNSNTILVNGETYIDVDSLDDNLNYKKDGVQSDCVSTIRDFDTDDVFSGNVTNATLFLKDTNPVDSNDCLSLNGGGEPLVLSNTSNAQALFSWVDEDRIQENNIGTIFNKESGSNRFIQQTNLECKDFVNVESPTTGSYFDQKASSQSCVVDNSKTVTLSNPENAAIVGGAGTAIGDTEAGDETVESCEDNEGEFVFFICAIIGGMSDAINKLDSSVRKALDINQEYYESEGVRGAWASMRNIAYIMLIPVMLVMVIGTALGFSVVDAYTAKRAIPRMFAAIIFIALSYDICILLIEITTTVGKGVGGLIAAPFGGTSELVLTKIFAPTILDGGAILGVGVIGGIALVGLGAVSLGILASYLFIGAIALIIIFAVLTLREMIVLFLVILSPIAIIAWIFPGNDKPWKIWWSSFSKLLYLFPMIVGLLVMGRAFASILGGTGANGLEGVFITFAKLVAYIGPFFFIPALFKFAGGVFGNLAGMANDRSKGVFDRQRKYRGNTRKETMERAAAGGRIRSKNPLANKLNTVIGKGYAAKNAGLNPLNMKANTNAAYDKVTAQKAAEVAEKDLNFAAFAQDDTVLKAATGNNSASTIAQALIDSGDQRFTGDKGSSIARRTAALVTQTKSNMGQSVYDKAALQAKAKAGTYYSNFGEMAKEVNDVYKDDRQSAGSAIMQMKSSSLSAGRVDLGGAGAGTTLLSLQRLYDEGFVNDAGEKKTFGMNDASTEFIKDVVDSQGPSVLTHPSMKRKYLEKNIIPEMQTRLDKAMASGDTQKLSRELASIAGTYDTLAQSSPATAAIFADQLMAYKPTSANAYSPPPDKEAHVVGPRMVQQGTVNVAPLAPSSSTVRELVEQYRNDESFLEKRREFGATEEQRKNALARGAQPGQPVQTSAQTKLP